MVNGLLVREIYDDRTLFETDKLYLSMHYMFNGDICYVRIYNRALTDEEILQNYQAGQCSPLLAMRGDI